MLENSLLNVEIQQSAPVTNWKSLVQSERGFYELSLIDLANASIQHLQFLENRNQDFTRFLREHFNVNGLKRDVAILVSIKDQEYLTELVNKLLLDHLLGFRILVLHLLLRFNSLSFLSSNLSLLCFKLDCIFVEM